MKKNILIAVPSQEVAQYIDQLLWRMPEDSFIPHAIVQGTTREKIAITTNSANVNQATILISLLPEIYSNSGSVDTIYELLDLTSKEKEAISRKKQEAYRAAGHAVEEI
jgi:DNA polymerase IIIc chi subunit